jgi:agmatinase
MSSFDPNAPALSGSGIYGLPHTPEEAAVVLVPVPWDATTSYRAGTSRGPEAIRAASAQVDLFDIELGRPYEAGIAMLPHDETIAGWNEQARADAEAIIEAGGVIDGRPDLVAQLDRVNAASRKVNARVYGQTERLLAAGKRVAIVGGDHSVPLGAIAALGARHPELGILHIDAHADLRAAYEGFTYSHASIMYNVLREVPQVKRIVQVGIRDFGEAEHRLIEQSEGRVVTHFDAQMHARHFAGDSWADECKRILATLPADVYVSFDIDGLDPSLCPHTGTPVPGGLSFAQATFLLGALARSGRRIVGFDLNEVAPGDDGDEWDANVGARLLYKMIGCMLQSGGG